MNGIYIMDVTVFDDPEKYNAAHALLSDERKAAVERYRFKKDKYLSVGAGYLLYRVLADAGITGFTVDKDGNGKPFIKDHPEIFFNMSHSGNLAVCAFASAPVGADIEKIREFKPALIKRVFSEEEVRQVSEGAERLPEELLYTRLWTAKESYVKYTGKGIGADFLKIKTEAGDDCLSLTLRSEDEPGAEAFVTGFEIPGYALSICMDAVKKSIFSDVKPTWVRP